MPPPPKAPLPKNPKKEAQRAAKAAAALIAESPQPTEGSSSSEVLTPSSTPPPQSITPSQNLEPKKSSTIETFKTNEKKSKFRLSPEDFPDIVVTCATNPKKVHPMAKDVIIEGLSVNFHGAELLQDSNLVLAHGQRYGLVGLNGVGKTTLLNVIAARMIPIPKTVDVYSVHHPIEPSDLTALQAVLQVDEEKAELEAEVDTLSDQMTADSTSEEETRLITERLDEIYERLEQLDASTAESRAAAILTGLGFDAKMQQKKTRDFSGGWRMRIALARALFLNPTLLVLDGPTAHLDLSSVVYLEETLKKFSKILLLVSHSQDFLNQVCTNIILFRQKKLTIFGGDYDTYVKTRQEKEMEQQRQHDWEQDQIQHMKEYIARFGHGSAKLARQAQSKEKTLARMVRGGLTDAVTFDKTVNIKFVPCGKIPPPVIQLQSVSFRYNENSAYLYQNLDFGADLDSRICLVGPNGAGKSTLLKLISGDLIPSDGMVRRHHQLRLATYSQHFVDQLKMDDTPLSFILREFPTDQDGKPNSLEAVRSIVGRFGITGVCQTMKISQLSDGQKARVVFSWIAEKRPHFILFDEPTNSLDAETTNALAQAINAWDGGVLLISHDFALVQQVAKEIFVCDKGKLTKFDGDMQMFKKVLRKEMGLE